MQICKLLISAGADKDVYDWNDSWYVSPCVISNRLDADDMRRTPLLAAADHNNEVIVNVTDGIDTIRLFSDSIDFSETRGSGWRAIALLHWNLFVSLPDGISDYDRRSNALIKWMHRFRASQIKKNFRKEAFPRLTTLLSRHDAAEVANLALSRIDSHLDGWRGSETDYALQIFISSAGARDDMGFNLNLMLNKGVYLHLVCHQSEFGGISQTPTSLALYSSFLFVKWRDALLRSPVDLESFVEEEVQQSPLRDVGWHKASLLALFRCKIQPDHLASNLVYCDDCPQLILFLCVELSWREWLNRFKDKADFKYSSDAAYGGVDRDQSNREILQQNSPSLEVEDTLMNEFCDEQETADETGASDLYQQQTTTERLDAYISGESRHICMRCYLKRQGYGSEK